MASRKVQPTAGEAPSGAPRPNQTEHRSRTRRWPRPPRTTEPRPLANPFRPGNGVPPPYLAGRDRLLAEFERFLVERAAPSELDADRPARHRQDRPARRVRGRAPSARAGSPCSASWGSDIATTPAWPTRSRRTSTHCIAALSPLAAVGQAIERRRALAAAAAHRHRRDRRTSPPMPSEPADAADRMRDALGRARRQPWPTPTAPGALLLYDEAHLLADDRGARAVPAVGPARGTRSGAARSEPRVRIVLCGLPTLSLNLKRARTYAERMFRHVVVDNLDRERRLGCARPSRSPAAGAAFGAVAHRPDRRGRPRATPTSCSSSARIHLQSDRPGTRRGLGRRLPGGSRRPCSTSWTSPSSRTASRGASPPSSASSRRWQRERRPGTAGAVCDRELADLSGLDLLSAGWSNAASSIAPAAAPTTSPCRCSAASSGGVTNLQDLQDL